MRPIVFTTGIEASLTREELEEKGYTFEVEMVSSSEGLVFALFDGETIGKVHFISPPNSDYIFPLISKINEEHRRLGLATAMYDEAEQTMGKAMEPSDDLSEDSKALWENRLKDDPKAMELWKRRVKVEASGDNHEWGCLMLNFPEDFSSQVVAWGEKNVPADVLYNDEEDPTGYGLEKQIHTTVVYGLDPKVTPEELNDILGMYVNIPVTIGKLSKFENKGKYDVLKFDVISDDLHAAHKAIKDALPTPGETFPDFKPHQTVAYVLPGSCDHLLGEAPFEGQSFILREFDYSRPPAPGKKDKHTVFEVDNLRASAGVRHGLTLGPITFQAKEQVKFWMNPDHEITWRGGYHDEHENNMPEEWEGVPVDHMVSAGWVRGFSGNNMLFLDLIKEEQVDAVLSALPTEWIFPDQLVVDLQEGESSSLNIPVEPGEDAIKAWEHRNDIRHRVTAKLHPIIFADEAFQLRKAAIASIENDPKYTNYRNDPKIANELGALQQALNDARDEGAIQEAWLKFQPTTPFEALKANA